MAIPTERPVNVLIVGGTGHWSEKNHYPTLLALRSEGIRNRVVAICDPINPYTAPIHHYAHGRTNLHQILANDRPDWLDPSTVDKQELEHVLDQQHSDKQIDITIVACDPTEHFFYSRWAVQHGISVFCDKPPVLVPMSSFRPDSVREIAYQFNQLIELVQAKQAVNPALTFYVPLKRRLNKPFIALAHGLAEVYDRTGQCITYMTAILNNGLHRYPVEFLNQGAHGYLAGVGALAHTTYHILDLIAWYLGVTKGDIARIGVSVPYVFRISDYLRSKTYKRLIKLIEEEMYAETGNLEFPQAVLNAELDFTVHIALYDGDNNKIGLISYTSNHTTFSPRQMKYDPEILEPGNEKLGGRMHQLFMDIHQGAIQNYVLMQNNEIFSEAKTTDIIRRMHPKLGKSYEVIEYPRSSDFEDGMKPTDVFKSFIRRGMGFSIPHSHEKHLQVWMMEKLTHELFIACYKKIAETYVDSTVAEEIGIMLKE
jgi:hypothetical protein